MANQEIAQRVKKLREKLYGQRGGIAAFMRATGIDSRLLSKYEQDVEPTASNLARIIMSTKCSAAWLLTGAGDMFACDLPGATDRVFL